MRTEKLTSAQTGSPPLVSHELGLTLHISLPSGLSNLVLADVPRVSTLGS